MAVVAVPAPDFATAFAADSEEYVGIKLSALPHFLWFERKNSSIYNGYFCAKDGWGPGGALTHVGAEVARIEAWIFSAEAQYE